MNQYPVSEVLFIAMLDYEAIIKYITRLKHISAVKFLIHERKNSNPKSPSISLWVTVRVDNNFKIVYLLHRNERRLRLQIFHKRGDDTDGKRVVDVFIKRNISRYPSNRRLLGKPWFV